jgi:hypothetical protein
MDEETFLDRKAELDEGLARTDERAGIAFGSELWQQLRRRQLLAMRDFGWLGTRLLVNRLPSYEGHFAFEDFELPEYAFQIGRKRTPDQEPNLERGFAIRVIIELLVANKGRYSRQEAKHEVLRRMDLVDDPSNMMGFAARRLSEDGIISDLGHERDDYVFTELGRKTYLEG